MERQSELKAQSLWREVSARLRQALNEATYQTWFGEARGIGLTERYVHHRRAQRLREGVDRRAIFSS